MNFLKTLMKFEENLEIASRKNLIRNLYKMKNI